MSVSEGVKFNGNEYVPLKSSIKGRGVFMGSNDLEKLFVEDSLEALEKLEANLLHIENNSDIELVNELFRAIHSIKGGASLLEYQTLTSLAHLMENFLGAVRENKVVPTKTHVDALLEGTDLIKKFLPTPKEKFEYSNIKNALQLSADCQDEEIGDQEITLEDMESKEKASETKNATDGVSDDVSMLLNMANELRTKLNGEDSGDNGDVAQLLKFSNELQAQLDGGEKKTKKQNIEKDKEREKVKEKKKESEVESIAHSDTKKTVTDQSVRIYVNKLNKLVDLAGELVLARNQLLNLFKDKVQNQIERNIFQNTDRVTTQMQTEIMSMRMQSISLVFDKFPRLVRELSSKLKKDIKLSIEGENVELDKTLIEAISDPLIHLVRNCADHGIETPEIRKSKGKVSFGKIILKAFHSGGLVHIQISDDGNGIDTEIISKKVIEKGIMSKSEIDKLSQEEKLKLIFAPGFSTAETITDISGRGVGMDVVRTNIERIGGSIEIETIVGKGTTFKITLPLTLAIISSLIVRVNGQNFAIPQVSFEELIRVTTSEFREKIALVGDGQVLRLRGELIPLMHLSDCIRPEELKTKKHGAINYSQTKILDDGTVVEADNSQSMQNNNNDNIKVMIVTTGEIRIGLVVDQIIGFEEIIVKSLPIHLRYLHYYAGVTILGDGKVALIIDVHGIALRNRLAYEKSQGLSLKLKKAKQISNDKIMLLLFDKSYDLEKKEQFALPLAIIQRVDRIPLSGVHKIGEKNYINYMGHTTQLIDAPELEPLDVYSKSAIQDITIVVPKNTAIPLALRIGRIIDTKDVSLKIEENSIKNQLFMGTAIIDDEITILLNLHGILEHHAPNCFKLERKEKNVLKILLAEDTPLYQQMSKSYLEEEGHNVVLVENGEEAYRLLEEDDSSFDVLVTDIEMPIMDGLDLSERIRSTEKMKHLPIIALTSISNKETVEKGMRIGINRWLNKTDRNGLIRSLYEVVNHGGES